MGICGGGGGLVGVRANLEVGIWKSPIRVCPPSAISHATFSRCPFNTLLPYRPSFILLTFLPTSLAPLPSTNPLPFLSSPPVPNVRPTPQMPVCKKRRGQFVHPPFPSIAWVMTAEANPPSSAYAHGYVRNARAQSGMRARPPGRCAVPPRRPHLPRWPHSTRPAPPPPAPPSPTKAQAATVPVEHDKTFMETVDYRYHDPPSRPYVPWLEGYTLRGRGAQRAANPDTTTGVSNCRLDGSAAGSDHARSKKRKRMWTRTTVENNRLDIVLSALRRACRLSAKEEPS